MRSPCAETDRIDLAFEAAEAGDGAPLPDDLRSHASTCPDCAARLEERTELAALLARLRYLQQLPLPEAAPEPAPERIGPYRILRQLGAGGMGVVYLAEQESPRRAVALKVVRPDRLSTAARRRFEREIEFLGQLEHVGIARIFEAGVATTAHGEQPWFAMEWVQGERLLDHARVRRLDLRARIGLALGVCDALRYAHQRGVLHRDLKPTNVLVDAQGRPRLLDFGIARSLDDGSAVAPVTDASAGGIPGTLAYMSPEQVRGQGDALDIRSDVYSFGVLLFELVTGELPHEPVAADRYETMRRICEDPPRRPGRLLPGLGADLEAILLHTVEKDPGRRYPTIDALAADLRAWLEHRPLLVRPPTPLGALARWARREPWKATVAGVVALLLVALASAQVLGLAVARRSEIDAAQAQRARERLEAALERGFLSLAARSYEPARAGFEAALALAPDEPEAAVGLALALMQLGRSEEALARLEAAPLELRESPARRQVMADLLRSLGRDEEAQAAVADLEPARTPVELFLQASRLLTVTNPAVVAREDRLLARSLMERAILGAPTARLLYHAMLARVLASVGSEAEVERQAQAMQELWPDSSASWFWTGYLFQDRDPVRAAAAYRRALEITPELSPAWTNLGLTLREEGNLAAAQAAHERALAIDPDNAVAWNNLGTTFNALGEYEAAEQAFARSIKLDPEFVFPWNGLATARDRRGDKQGALMAARRSVELRPDLGGGWHNLGVLLHDTGQPEEALEALARATAAEPGHWRAHSRRCEILRQLGRTEGLAEHLPAWRAALGQEADAWCDHAWFLMDEDADPRTQDLPAALEAAEQAVALARRPDPEHYSALASACFANAKIPEAVAAAERAHALLLEASPQDPQVLANAQALASAYRDLAAAVAAAEIGSHSGSDGQTSGEVPAADSDPR